MSTAKRVQVFAPASVGNVGPGFDVLGFAVEGLGDTITAEPTDGPIEIAEITGRDAALVPTNPEKNVATIAAKAFLQSIQESRGVRLSIHKGLPLSGGLGGSAASSVAGALAAAAVFGHDLSRLALTDAALAGEQAVAGRHVDNIAPCVWGGFTLVRANDPPDIVALEVRGDWWFALCTPHMHLETKTSRSVLPASLDRAQWVQQMANTSALVHAFAAGDRDLVRRSMHDHFAEPARAPLIPGFYDVKHAAFENGAVGCSISGAGPTIFAMCEDQRTAENALQAMIKAFGAMESTGHVGRIDRQGARVL